MKTWFMVLEKKGPSWDPTKLRRSQALWDEHAAFMDQLVAEGFVVLGGPLGEGDGDDVLLVIDAPDEDTIISTLKNDPWSPAGILEVKAIQRWTIFSRIRKTVARRIVVCAGNPTHGGVWIVQIPPTTDKYLRDRESHTRKKL